MKIAVIGGGAIGSIVAGFLAKSGEKDILLVGRKEHVDAINANGLKVISAEGEEIIQLKAATELDQDYHLVIFATKTQDIEEAYQANVKFLHNAPIILSTQNGVQADNILGGHFEPSSIISSIVMFGATYVKPGEVVYNFPGDWILGKPFSANDLRLTEVNEILSKAFKTVTTQNIVGMKWLKLFVNFNNCIPAMVGKSMQETFTDIELCKLSIRLLKEGVDIVDQAKIKLISLPEFPVERIVGLVSMPEEQAAGIINKTLTTLSKKPLYGSILQSIMRKKLSEIDFINGEVVVLAKSLGRKSPLNTQVVDFVHKVENDGTYFKIDDIKREFQLN